jgi:hypothetical protein
MWENNALKLDSMHSLVATVKNSLMVLGSSYSSDSAIHKSGAVLQRCPMCMDCLGIVVKVVRGKKVLIPTLQTMVMSSINQIQNLVKD